jgi:hypothetical protein
VIANEIARLQTLSAAYYPHQADNTWGVEA